MQQRSIETYGSGAFGFSMRLTSANFRVFFALPMTESLKTRVYATPDLKRLEDNAMVAATAAVTQEACSTFTFDRKESVVDRGSSKRCIQAKHTDEENTREPLNI